ARDRLALVVLFLAEPAVPKRRGEIDDIAGRQRRVGADRVEVDYLARVAAAGPVGAVAANARLLEDLPAVRGLLLVDREGILWGLQGQQVGADVLEGRLLALDVAAAVERRQHERHDRTHR